MIVTLICTKQIQAQTTGSYITNNTMGAFHGTWRWINDVDTVTLYLITKKVYFDINGGIYADRLVGWHIYKKGNITIESSFGSIPNLNYRTFDGGNENLPTNTVSGTFKDLTKHKEGELKLTLNTTLNQLTWRSTEHPGMRVYANPQDVPPAGLTLPRNMVLIKQ